VKSEEGMMLGRTNHRREEAPAELKSDWRIIIAVYHLRLRRG